jgi:P27 family predicted phage terminase small subunit
MMRGRKPTPTALKRLAGNPGKRRLNPKEPKPATVQTSALRPRRFLDKYGREEWERVVPELDRLGLLTRVDLAAVEVYCDLYAQWRRARLKLRTGFSDGHGKRKPEVQVTRDAAALMRQFMVEFGLTPSSRSRLEIEAPAALSLVKPTGTEGKPPGRFFRD